MTDTEQDRKRTAYWRKRCAKMEAMREAAVHKPRRHSRHRQVSAALDAEGKRVIAAMRQWMASEPIDKLMLRCVPVLVWAYMPIDGSKPQISFEELPDAIRFGPACDNVDEDLMFAKFVELGVNESRARELADGPREFYLSGFPRMTRREYLKLRSDNPDIRENKRAKQRENRRNLESMQWVTELPVSAS